jgi:hypothetical protein
MFSWVLVGTSMRLRMYTTSSEIEQHNSKIRHSGHCQCRTLCCSLIFNWSDAVLARPSPHREKLHLALTIAATTYLYAHSIVSSLNRQSKRIRRLDSKSSTCPHAIFDFLRFPIFEQPFAALVKQSEQIGRLNSKSSTGPYACGKTSWVPSFEQPIAAALIKQSK